MSDEHRAALKKGRQESAAIRRYLEAIGRRKPGRPVTKESLEKRISALSAQIGKEDNPLKRIELEQRRIDAEKAMAAMGEGPDVASLEKEFVKHAKAYSKRKGISYQAWRAGGVPAAVLKQAGISRSGR